MQFRIQACAARQYETAERRQTLIRFVNLTLQLLYLASRDARLFWMHILRQSGQDGAEIEQFVLYPAQDPQQPFERRMRTGELCQTGRRLPDKRIQLIHRAVGLQPG